MKPLWCRRRGGLLGPLALLLALPLAAGCGGGQGKVSGRVMYNDRPVTGGWLTFRPADGSKNLVPAQINEDGSFEVTLPTGEVQIAVDNRELERPPPGRRPTPPPLPPGVKLPSAGKSGGASPAPASPPQDLPGAYVPIPARYYDVDTSGLTYIVRPGAQTYTIELK